MTEAVPEPKRYIPEPEAVYKQYKDAVNEKARVQEIEDAVSGTSLKGAAMRMLGMSNAQRFNAGMRGPEIHQKRGEYYTTENLDVIKPKAIADMKAETGLDFDDGSNPNNKIYPENLPKQ